MSMQKIHSCLWFKSEAEQAMNFYLGIFPNSKVTNTLRWGDVGPGPKGSIVTCSFEFDGQTVMLLNGNPQFAFTPAVSLVINCADQAEVDHYWSKLLDGGQTMACGWLSDKFGVSWQIVPTMLPKLLTDPDRAKADRVMAAMMEMIKLDVATLQKAADAR